MSCPFAALVVSRGSIVSSFVDERPCRPPRSRSALVASRPRDQCTLHLAARVAQAQHGIVNFADALGNQRRHRIALGNGHGGHGDPRVLPHLERLRAHGDCPSSSARCSVPGDTRAPPLPGAPNSTTPVSRVGRRPAQIPVHDVQSRLRPESRCTTRVPGSNTCAARCRAHRETRT